MMGREFVPIAGREIATADAGAVGDVGEWWSQARCRGLPTEMFFVPDGDRGRSRLVRETRAKRVCQSCPVLRQCGTYAVSAGERHGVWGALTPMERAERRVLLGIEEALAAGA
ncbi:WhiB family transcriptional regulator [Mycobacteroides immunogenum]|uniref:WhiB family transcriptional regulator n=1 Tax=Mycobacteroides immunogenum TaxID=83262 RepID=UPI001F2C2B83|nr:WhiB family transcriptional regulator [Mycobacteroides immunogenum]WJR33522.1 WhiB family transcriptional regulator [Mycobacteroides immunogenum]